MDENGDSVQGSHFQSLYGINHMVGCFETYLHVEKQLLSLS